MSRTLRHIPEAYLRQVAISRRDGGYNSMSRFRRKYSKRERAELNTRLDEEMREFHVSHLTDQYEFGVYLAKCRAREREAMEDMQMDVVEFQ
jgi:hypothetical protein